MGSVFEGIDDELREWIERQPMWFVATAPLAADGHVNVSPRGLDSFSVLGPTRVAWVDFTGSGIETVAHLRENGRVCLMFASFDAEPRIVRLHGTGRVSLPGESEFDEVVSRHPLNPSTRAVITVDLTRVSDACGWGVPLMEPVGERDTIRRAAEKAGPEAMATYRAGKNALSLDGLPGL